MTDNQPLKEVMLDFNQEVKQSENRFFRDGEWLLYKRYSTDTIRRIEDREDVCIECICGDHIEGLFDSVGLHIEYTQYNDYLVTIPDRV